MMTVACIIVTAILSPLVCVAIYLCWKAQQDVRKIMRRDEFIDAIKTHWEVQKAITDLITEKAKSDSQLQQAVVSITKKERA
jgi:hypothetical protein